MGFTKTVLYQRGLTQTTGAGLGSELVTAVNTVDKSFTAEHSFPRNVDSILLRPTVAVFMCHSTNSMHPSATPFFQVLLQTQQEAKMRLNGMAVQVVRKNGIVALYNGLTASMSRQVCAWSHSHSPGPIPF